MNIEPYIEEFIKKSKYCSYKKICRNVLLGGKPFSLNSQIQYQESEYLPENIPLCVKAYTRDKDEAIHLFRDFVAYLNEHGANVRMSFPPVPVSNSFERLMYIAKYLQEEDHRISDLGDVLWVSNRTIENDLNRLRGKEDPIQVCGKAFVISETERRDGKLKFASTAHPLFLTENLSQIIIILRGLRQMSLDPLYEPYALASASDIWNQLSRYAKRRIRYMFKDILPEELSWYESLDKYNDKAFYTETDCSRSSRKGTGVILDCMKNGKTWCMEYLDGDSIVFYKDCRFKEKTYNNSCLTMIQSSEEKTISLDNVIRSAYSLEELLDD